MVKLLLIFAAVLFSAACATAQDWKTVYDKAIQQYQEGQYAEALASAKDAYKASAQLDPKNQAYSLQLITVVCLDDSNGDEGLLWIEKEAALFLQIEGDKSKTYAEALSKHARFLVQKGQFPAAESKCKETLTVYSAAGLASSPEYADTQFLLGQVLALTNKPTEALPLIEASVTAFSVNPERGEEYIDAMLLSASLSEKMKDAPAASKKYKQLIVLLEKNGLQQLPAYGQAQTALSKIATATGNTAEASEILKSGAVDPAEKARQHLKIAIDYQNAHQLALAEENYLLAEKTVAENKLQNNTAFSVYLNHGRMNTGQKKFSEAASLLEQATATATALYPSPSQEWALLEFAKGDLGMSRGSTQEGKTSYIKALASAGELPLALRVQSLNRAAKNLLVAEQPAPAIDLLQGVMSVLPDKAVSDALFMEAVATYTLALAENHQTDIAIRTLKELSAKPVTPLVKVALTQQQAAVLKESGQWSAALALLNQSVNETTDPLARIRLDYQLGDLNLLLGNFGEAEKHLLGCVEGIRKHAPTDNLQLDAFNSLAMLYTRLGNYERAETMYMDLLKQPDPVPGFHTSIQQNLASLYFESARYTEAELLLEDVLRQDRERYGEDHPDYATSMQNLAAVYQKNKELVKARDLYEKALALDARLGGTGSISYATKAANLGIVYEEAGDLNKAQQYLESALKIREKKLGKDHPDYVFNQYNLANVYEELGQSAKALPLFRRVGAFYVQEIHELFPAMSEQEKTAFYNKISEVINSYLDFTIKHASTDKALTGELYDFRLTTKALLLNSSSKIRNRILSSRDPQLMEAFTSWLTTKEELGKLYSLPFEEREANRALITTLQQKGNELERLLSKQSELFAETSGREGVNWKSVQQSLLPGEAAIEIIRLGLDAKADSVLYAALVLKPAAPLPGLIVFPHSRKLETKEFSFYRNSVQYQLANERSYGFYWKPLEQALQGVDKVYLSADGVFNKVNVATLFNPLTKKYLVEQFSIVLVSNSKELVSTVPPTAPARSAALFGNPEFGKGPGTQSAGGSHTRGMSNLARGIIGGGIPDLPGTLDEITQLSSFLKQGDWETNVYLGGAATEVALKTQSNPGVLHIATHGFFVETADEQEAVVSGGDLAQSAQNPLLRSGLVLAGAGKFLIEKGPAGEDGVLTAYEAMNLTLDKTDLVVLSACETGAGEVRNGEGVYGLQRAFLLAGASNMLMSLWKVDDQATQELMLQFYKDLHTMKDKAQAFRNTQLEIKKIHPEPYYWGSFVMIGHN
jgi:CHAT domain-containing protein/Tfp pilus assembly protein PilF